MISITKSLRTSSPRSEYKGVIEGPLAGHAALRVTLHPAMFRREYPRRQVNNVYLDTHDLTLATVHLSGAAERYKVRVRWYGALTGRVERPVLEFKGKSGHVGYKFGVSLRRSRSRSRSTVRRCWNRSVGSTGTPTPTSS